MRAYYSGEWEECLAIADGFLGRLDAATPHAWEIHLRVLRAWLRLLRGEADEADVERALALARRGNFPQLRRPALAYAALCRLLQDRSTEAASLYDELDADWGQEPSTASREWVQATVSAAAQLDRLDGGKRLATLLDRLGGIPRPTLWVRAAHASAAAHFAVLSGSPAEGADHARAAAATYDEIGDMTESAMAALQVGLAYLAADRPVDAAPWLASARQFFERNAAKRLMDRLGEAGRLRAVD
jgi:hypothetical protein